MNLFLTHFAVNAKAILWNYIKKTLREKDLMNVYCHNCSFQNKYSTSCKSNTKGKVSDVNLRGTLAIISAGGGHSSLKKFCSTMDFLPPVASHPYNSYIWKPSAVCENSAKKNVAANRRKLFLKKDKGDLVECEVTVDGTWKKRYGNNSKLGATFVLSADTGEVLDYVIKSTYCKECHYYQNDDIDSEKYKN